ncbi:hypothetical protein KW791_02955 [Candidatus Parcubacteria bacterium]|nr:hypothetical protein [Candidatus Parcubacteria bacterium]
MHKTKNVAIIVAVAVILSIVVSTVVMAGKPRPWPVGGEISVTAPNGGEVFIQGAENVISWSGGNRIVAVGIVGPETTTDYALSSLVGWISTAEGNVTGFYGPDSSTKWDGKEVCSMGDGGGCRPLPAGSYKVIVWSEDANGSWYIASGNGKNGKYSPNDYRGNWNVSSRPFTIK